MLIFHSPNFFPTGTVIQLLGPLKSDEIFQRNTLPGYLNESELTT